MGGLRLLGQGRALLRNIVRLAGNTRHSCGHQWKVAFVFVKCSRPPAFWVHLLSFSLFFFPPIFIIFVLFFPRLLLGNVPGGRRRRCAFPLISTSTALLKRKCLSLFFLLLNFYSSLRSGRRCTKSVSSWTVEHGICRTVGQMCRLK